MKEIIKRNREALGLPSKVGDINGWKTMNAVPVRFFANDPLGGWLINDGVVVGRDAVKGRD